jgi:hypothetical protein
MPKLGTDIMFFSDLKDVSLPNLAIVGEPQKPLQKAFRIKK